MAAEIILLTFGLILMMAGMLAAPQDPCGSAIS
jgi:hypothetical protein